MTNQAPGAALFAPPPPTTRPDGPVLCRLRIALRARRGFCERYALHQAVLDLWDGHRPVWRLFRHRGDTADLLVLADRMTTGRPTGAWGRVCGVSVGPLRAPRGGERVRYAGTIIATAKPNGGDRCEISEHYRDEDPGELYAGYLQRRIDQAAVVETAEVHRINPYAVRRGGDRRETMRHTAADVAGLLTVRDPAALMGVLTLGIGRGKAWGFGLVMLSGEDWSWWG